MCLIIHKPKEQVIDEALLRDAATFNRDGWGIMYCIDGEVRTVKGTEVNELVRECAKLDEKQEAFVHLRMRTHGTISEDNIHPFQIGKTGVYMMHNGTIQITRKDNNESDSAAFARMLAPLIRKNHNLLFEPALRTLIRSYIGNSRLAFLLPDGRSTLIGNGDWAEWKGCPVSNKYAWSLHRKGVTYSYSTSHYGRKWNAGGNTTSPSYTNYNPVPPHASSTSNTLLQLPPGSNTQTVEDTAPDWVRTDTSDDSYELLQADTTSVEDTDIQQYTLEELMGMDYATVEWLGYQDPAILVKAIWEAAIENSV